MNYLDFFVSVSVSLFVSVCSDIYTFLEYWSSWASCAYSNLDVVWSDKVCYEYLSSWGNSGNVADDIIRDMNSLILINETFTNGYRAEVLDFISLASILSGIFVIISKNPIVSVLFLIGLFLSIACYLLVLGISFIGLSYLLVYVGAVSILFLFILMLINVRISELLSDTSNSIPLALVIAVSFNYPVYQILPLSLSAFNSSSVSLNKTLNDFTINNKITDYLSESINFSNHGDEIVFVTSKIWDGSLAETTHITSIGNIMYTSYSIWLIITSIILLLAMVGAIVITIKQKN